MIPVSRHGEFVPPCSPPVCLLNFLFWVHQSPSVDQRMRNKHVLCDFVSSCTQSCLFFSVRERQILSNWSLIELMWVWTRHGAKKAATVFINKNIAGVVYSVIRHTLKFLKYIERSNLPRLMQAFAAEKMEKTTKGTIEVHRCLESSSSILHHK